MPWKTKKQRRLHHEFNPRLHFQRRKLINQSRSKAITRVYNTPYIPPARWSEIAYETKQYESQERYDKKERVQLAVRKWKRSLGTHLVGLTAHAMASSASAAPKPNKAKYMVFDSGSYPILVDNCASSSITNCLADFKSPPIATSKVIQGVNGELTALRVGTIQWRIQDDTGRTHHLTLPNSYYAPSSPYRLLSPQHWAQVAKDHAPKPKGTWSATYDTEVVLHWGQNRFTKTVQLHRSSNVGMFQSAPSNYLFTQACLASDLESPFAFTSTIDLSDPEEQLDLGGKPSATPNSDPSKASNEAPGEPPTIQLPHDFNFCQPTQGDVAPIDEIEEPDHPEFDSPWRELLHWHRRLGHLSFARIKHMAKLGILPKKLATVKPPMCSSCQHAKAKKKPWRSKATQRHIYKQVIDKPGECVSVDQLESSVPGLIGQMKGILTKQRYRVATIFVDHATRLGFPYMQKSTTSEETVAGKDAFEAYSATYGVTIQHYHCDNGRFADNLWRDSAARANQTLSYSGVGASFQNGVAEKRIGDLQGSATTMLLHAERCWPQAINTHLWPYAIRMASDVYNSTPRIDEDASPIENFAGFKMRPLLNRFHHFGCPVYVLHRNLQSGKKGRKWENRARVGIYVGHSIQHAKSVALVLSLDTGLVSPQFHCSYDDMFETVEPQQRHLLPHSKWQEKTHFTAPKLDAMPISGNELERGLIVDRENEGIPEGAIFEPIADEPPAEAQPHLEGTAPNIEPQPRQSMRERRMPMHLQDYHVSFETLISTESLANEPIHPLVMKASTDPDIMYYHEAIAQPDRKQWEIAVQKEIADHEKGKHWELVLLKDVPSGTKILPAVWAMRRKRRIDTQVVYKWKARLNIDGSKQQYGIHYWETYAPVVSWPVIRFFLTLSLLRGWETRQLDFVLAYTQADVETDLYMKIPIGYNRPGVTANTHALKLVKNLYGQKQAGRVWNQYMVEKLKKLGFRQSDVDECVFYYRRSVMIVYTDDCIIMGPDTKQLDRMFKKLQSEFDITLEGTLCDYLGILIKKDKEGGLTLTQPHLIASILKDLGLDKPNSNSKETPARTTKIITPDQHEPPHETCQFDYRSVIGKLNYLEKSTRPELAAAVHQCARFCSDPRQTHTEAVKRIGRYLVGTKDKGLVLKPGETESFECWVDSSHAGEWNREGAEHDPSTARSRMGYVFMYAKCPILWASKMQTEIALSTTEAEYIALSMAVREIIPLTLLFQEAKDRGIDVDVNKAIVRCKLFEDNRGAAEIARVPKFRPRTKHINLKYHHFREHVKSGLLQIEDIATEDQLADIFTKPLGEVLFHKFRKGILGW
eukprot:CAMPEP_0172414700 /NCGR_PEP_ID=MMETSP1064-20121228/1332_1 /TAXON_ID=202472 /ORGANISM="Aulacoseira subarctica , Strain CCAP 1002/5" /LENGTH=1323 /DNA_ID=CAMNT_0013151491 /DNA_START=262 /DNA_END=4233 /DNA_ORIENTATION=+